MRCLKLLFVLFVVSTATAYAAPTGSTSPVLSVAFSPSGGLLASGEQNGDITLWSVPQLGVVRTLKGHADGVTSLVFSRDGHTLYSASMDRKVRAWNLDSGHETAALGPHSDDVLFIALAPDGSRLAAASYDGRTAIWDLAKKTRLPVQLIGHTVDWSRDGKWISTASIDGTVRLYTAAGKESASWKAHTLCPNVARFSPDGRALLTCVDHVKIWDTKTHALLADLDTKIPLYKLNSATWSPDAKHVAATTTFGGAVRFDRAAKGWTLHPLAPGTPAQAAAFSPDGRYLALGNFKGTLLLLDANSGKVVARRDGNVKVNPMPLPGRQH